jgi:hypothetical protein
MEKSSKEIEEYYRRMMVKLIKEAGTMIRIEMIRRQTLPAEINLNYAESLRKLIREDYELLSKPLEEILKESIERFKKGEDVEKILADSFINFLITIFQASILRPLPEMIKHIENVNSFLNSVINQMINELLREGIYLHSIEPIALPSQDVASVARGLKDALHKLDMAIGLLKGLIDASKT